MVKVYYSYQFSQTVSQPVSKQSNFVVIPQKKIILAGVNQYLAILGLKTGEPIKYIYENQRNVNVRVIKATEKRVYVGYEDGRISIYDIQNWEPISVLDLHKSTVSSIDVDQNDTKMISAGLDGHIFIWDLLSEECQKIKSAHSNGITQIIYSTIIINNKPINVIFSLGKDGFFKIWNVQTLLCISAITTKTTQAYSMHFFEEKHLVYIGTNKQDIPIIRINPFSTGFDDLSQIVGIIKRNNYCRCVQLIAQYNKMYLLNSEKKIQIYQLVSEQKLQKRKKRTVSRRKQKSLKQQKVSKQQIEEDNSEQIDLKLPENIEVNEYELSLVFLQEKTVLTKVYNMNIVNGKIYINNGVNISLLTQTSTKEAKIGQQITSFTSTTNQLQLVFPFLVQRTNTVINVFNCVNFNKLFQIDIKTSYCALFNGFLMVCTEENVQIWDLAKNQCVYTYNQQWTGCWVNKNKCLLWNQNIIGVFEVGYDKQKNIKIKQINKKYMEEKIVNAAFTPNFQKYAINLQNSQVHILFSDTHKAFLKLYGHKLPITSFDISSDGAILATGSIDKDIKLWDMDFGHCVKSVFAHQQGVTNVKFIPNTHYLVSVSKDSHVKFWDMDTHQLIQNFQQPMLELKALAVSNAGENIVAGGLDGGFRVWKQTNDQTIASDQEQKKMQKIMIEQYVTHKLASNEQKTRYEDLKHGEQIIEALEQNEQPITLLKMIKKIPAANLKSSLSFLHTHHRQKLEQYLNYFIQREYQQQICFRILDSLQNGSKLGSKLRGQFQDISKVLKMNREVLKLLKRTIKEQKSIGF